MENQEAIATEAAQETVVNINPLDRAAHMFSTSVPRIKALSGNMSRNALARVFKAIVEFPLAADYPKFRNKDENELFILTLATIDAKNMMTSAFSADMKKDIEREATDGIVKELLDEHVTEKKTTEESNGQ